MTATLTARRTNVKPRCQPGKPVRSFKPARTLKLALAPTADGRPGVLDVTVGKEFASYFLTVLPSDFGLAFRLEKFQPVGPVGGGGSEYDVLLDLASGHHSCECLGHLRHGHCKHTAGLAALVANGKLPAPAPAAPAFACNGCADRGYQPTAGGGLEPCEVCPAPGSAPVAPAGHKPAVYRSLGDAMRNAPEMFAGAEEDGSSGEEECAAASMGR